MLEATEGYSTAFISTKYRAPIAKVCLTGASLPISIVGVFDLFRPFPFFQERLILLGYHQKWVGRHIPLPPPPQWHPSRRMTRLARDKFFFNYRFLHYSFIITDRAFAPYRPTSRFNDANFLVCLRQYGAASSTMGQTLWDGTSETPLKVSSTFYLLFWIREYAKDMFLSNLWDQSGIFARFERHIE